MGVEVIGMSDTNYSRVTIKVHNSWGFRDAVKAAAERSGESVNGYMIKAICRAVIQDGGSFPVQVLDVDFSPEADLSECPSERGV